MSAAADALMGIFGFKRVEGEDVKTIEQTRRELFEAWLSKRLHVLNIGFMDGKYLLADDQEQWEAFNAALDAVVIHLPKQYDMGGIACDAHDRAVGMCRAAIEQAGLGIRVL